jgi:hypothetical protein
VDDDIDETLLKKIQFLERIEIPDLSEDEFLLLHLSPIWIVGHIEVALIGEKGKIVQISNDRIVGIAFQEEIISLKIKVILDSFLRQLVDKRYNYN